MCSEHMQYAIFCAMMDAPEYMEIERISDKQEVKEIVGLLKINTSWASTGSRVLIKVTLKEVLLYCQQAMGTTSGLDNFEETSSFNFSDISFQKIKL